MGEYMCVDVWIYIVYEYEKIGVCECCVDKWLLLVE